MGIGIGGLAGTRAQLSRLELALAVALLVTTGVAVLLARTTYECWRPRTRAHADTNARADTNAHVDTNLRTERNLRAETNSPLRIDEHAFDVQSRARQQPKRQLGHCAGSNASSDWRELFTSPLAGGSTLHAGAGVSPESALLVRDSWVEILVRASDQLGFVAETPDVYLHANPARLRAATCSDSLTLALYDGAIHVASTGGEIVASLAHEYVHHVLFRNQIREPWWFHEGAAMHIGGDEWSEWKLRAGALEPETLSAAPRDNLAPREREARYGQAYLMAGFVEERCRQREFVVALGPRLALPTDESLRCSGRELTRALRAGMKPDELFWWAAERWSTSRAEPARSAWLAYLARHR